MCEQFYREKSHIIYREHNASIEGFKAARDGKPKSRNPHDTYNYKNLREAWENGYGCYQEGIIPWALESLYRDKTGKSLSNKLTEQFKTERKLSESLEKLLN